MLLTWIFHKFFTIFKEFQVQHKIGAMTSSSVWWSYMSSLDFRNILWRHKGVIVNKNYKSEKVPVREIFYLQFFNLVKTECKKIFLFKVYLDFSETHDFREMTISVLHVMTSQIGLRKKCWYMKPNY